MMSSAATSSPVSASTLAYLMRWPVLRLIWLKETFSVSDVAGNRATGQVTSERRRKPFQLARGAMAYSENATDEKAEDTTGEPRFKQAGEGILQRRYPRREARGLLPGSGSAKGEAGPVDGEIPPRVTRYQNAARPGTSSEIRRCLDISRQVFARRQGIEASMATRQQRQIVEIPTQARQAEPGPSMLALLVASTGLAVLILGVLWFVFFRT